MKFTAGPSHERCVGDEGHKGTRPFTIEPIKIATSFPDWHLDFRFGWNADSRATASEDDSWASPIFTQRALSFGCVARMRIHGHQSWPALRLIIDFFRVALESGFSCCEIAR